MQENQVINICVCGAKVVFGSSCMSLIEVDILLRMLVFDMFRVRTANYIQTERRCVNRIPTVVCCSWGREPSALQI